MQGEFFRPEPWGAGSARNPSPGSAGVISTSVAGVQVTFDGIAAPLLTLSAGEIDCITPFELVGRATTTVQVQFNGVKSNPVLEVLNEGFTLNSPSNPAKPGSVMVLYISGAGQTNPPRQDGEINQAPAAPETPVTVSFANTPYSVTFAAAAINLAAGILQFNFVAAQQSTENVDVRAGQSSAYFPWQFSRT